MKAPDWAPAPDIPAAVRTFTVTRNSLGESWLQAVDAAVLETDAALIRRGINPYGCVTFIGEPQRRPLRTADGRPVLDAEGRPVPDLMPVYERQVKAWDGVREFARWRAELAGRG
ncbi:hypothetical protein FKB34_01880 [Glycocaulis profundi]|nr:hypothetical protein FKB34_01880 [Glycocaulis profundi]